MSGFEAPLLPEIKLLVPVSWVHVTDYASRELDVTSPRCTHVPPFSKREEVLSSNLNERFFVESAFFAFVNGILLHRLFFVVSIVPKSVLPVLREKVCVKKLQQCQPKLLLVVSVILHHLFLSRGKCTSQNSMNVSTVLHQLFLVLRELCKTNSMNELVTNVSTGTVTAPVGSPPSPMNATASPPHRQLLRHSSCHLVSTVDKVMQQLKLKLQQQHWSFCFHCERVMQQVEVPRPWLDLLPFGGKGDHESDLNMNGLS
ncbi:hypothetical protein BHE74_00041230 [Ensete ventricosum]|nr:hypothetical protein BHE74_00041230 [Ensete ventricosum]